MDTPDISLGGWLARRASISPNARALTFEGATLSYRQFLDRVDRLAAGLRAGGVCPGDRVGFLGFNHPSYLEALFAAARLGAIFVPLNFRLTGPELAYIIADAGVHTLIVDGDHGDIIDEIRPMIPVRVYVGTAHCHGQWQDYETLLEVPATDGLPVVDPQSVALIMYTSGTTGRPKGSMLTHANLWWNNVNKMHAVDIYESDVTLVSAPLFHIGGLNVTTLVTMQRGGEVLLFGAFEAGACLEAIPRYGVTTMFGVPAMFLFMSQHPSFDSADLTSLRTLICGGAPVPEPLIKTYNGRGIPIQQGYGLTETSPSVSLLSSEHALEKIGSAGQALLLVDLRIVDTEGQTVTGAGAVGEICVRGPNVMKGYWNRPDATAEAIDGEGWFHTGDAGYFDKDGFLFVSDRFKDMVITGGENVYPAEVESALYDHPAISEVAVIGVPDGRWGEAVVAVVAKKPDADLTLAELREFGGRSLARYKLPVQIHLVDALPRNPAGKVLKYELRERLAVAVVESTDSMAVDASIAAAVPEEAAVAEVPEVIESAPPVEPEAAATVVRVPETVARVGKKRHAHSKR